MTIFTCCESRSDPQKKCWSGSYDINIAYTILRIVNIIMLLRFTARKRIKRRDKREKEEKKEKICPVVKDDSLQMEDAVLEICNLTTLAFTLKKENMYCKLSFHTAPVQIFYIVYFLFNVLSYRIFICKFYE